MLTVAGREAFEGRIDRTCPAERSIVLRYRDAVRFDPREEVDRAVRRALAASSLREGVRTVPLPEYRGVSVLLLDESTLMETGSMKAVDGCVAAAFCRAGGTGRMAFESGGNTGSALTRYGRAAGVETFFLCPAANLDLLDSPLFRDPGAHLAAVTDRRRLKEFASLFSARAGVRHGPDRRWRRLSSLLRGLFLLERTLLDGPCDWVVQAVSAAFGPLGIYEVLETFRKDVPKVPAFLGVQQEGNCPLFRAWRGTAPPAGEVGQAPLLARVMYDESPGSYGTEEGFLRLLGRTGGAMTTVGPREFYASFSPSSAPAAALRSAGVDLGYRGGEVVEKSGPIALAGTFKAIDEGIIPPGSRVVCCLTGGTGRADGLAEPEAVLRDEGDVLAWARKAKGEG